MKKRIATLLLAVVAAGALLAGPARADSDDYNHWRARNEWREHHPYQGDRWYQGYRYNRQPPWSYGESRYENYGYRRQAPWNYGQWRDHRWWGHHDDDDRD
jgi:hypothetical protein